MKERDDHINPIWLALASFAVLLCAPGLLLTWAVGRALAVPLDRGQLWIFGVAASLALTAIITKLSPSRASGYYCYILASLASLLVVALSLWGFHMPWATAFLDALGR